MAGRRCAPCGLANPVARYTFLPTLLLSFPPWVLGNCNLVGPSKRALFLAGHCGWCRGLVRIVLGEEQSDRPFWIAALDGETSSRQIPKQIQAELPNSIVVVAEDKAVPTRSAGIAARILGLVPRLLRDLGYASCAPTRKSPLVTPSIVSPVARAVWRGRFRN